MSFLKSCHFRLCVFLSLVTLSLFTVSAFAEKKPAYLLTAEKYYQQNNYKQSIKVIHQAKQKKSITLEGLVLASLCHIQLDDNKSAIQSIQETLAIDPKNEKSYLLWGMIYDNMQNYQQARLIYENGLQHIKTSVPILHELGMTLLSLNEVQQSLAHLEKALKINPDNIELATDYSYALLQNNNSEKAELLLAGVLKKQPKHKEAWYLIAKTYIHQKKFASAIVSMKNSLRFGYRNHQVYHDLALLYAQYHQNTLAIQTLNEEKELLGENAQSEFTLAKLYLQEKEFDTALKLFEKISKKDKSNEIITWIQKTKSMMHK